MEEGGFFVRWSLRVGVVHEGTILGALSERLTAFLFFSFIGFLSLRFPFQKCTPITNSSFIFLFTFYFSKLHVNPSASNSPPPPTPIKLWDKLS